MAVLVDIMAGDRVSGYDIENLLVWMLWTERLERAVYYDKWGIQSVFFASKHHNVEKLLECSRQKDAKSKLFCDTENPVELNDSYPANS